MYEENTPVQQAPSQAIDIDLSSVCSETFSIFLKTWEKSFIILTIPFFAYFFAEYFAKITFSSPLKYMFITSIISVLFSFILIAATVTYKYSGDFLISTSTERVFKKIFALIGAHIITSILIIIGLIFFIVPGIYLMIRFSFTPHAILVEGYGPIQAISRSAKLAEGLYWRIFILYLIFLFISIGLGMFSGFLGIFISHFSIPLSALLSAFTTCLASILSTTMLVVVYFRIRAVKG